MKILTKLPLYLGLSVFIFSVVITAVKIGENKVLINNRSQAAGSGTSLSLHFTPPNIVSVILTSSKDVAGIDEVIKFDKSKISVLSSSLTSQSGFVTSGGLVNDDEGTFSFSSLSKPGFKNTGIVATFEIKLKESITKEDTELNFDTTGDKTVVIEKDSGRNILDETKGTKFTISQQ